LVSERGTESGFRAEDEFVAFSLEVLSAELRLPADEDSPGIFMRMAKS
jgi:hypothetical protein